MCYMGREELDPWCTGFGNGVHFPIYELSIFVYYQYGFVHQASGQL